MKSKINFRHLLEDLGDAYTYSKEEAVLVELVANSLDAKCKEIRFEVDLGTSSLTVKDDGEGMSQVDFNSYHDIAASLKLKGSGIGFAGLGAKLGHLITEKVVTETNSDSYRGSSEWKWVGDELEWHEINPSQLNSNGTAVTLFLKPDSKLLDTEFLIQCIQANFGSLLDPFISEIYRWDNIYPRGIALYVNGEKLTRKHPVDQKNIKIREEIEVLVGGKRLGRGVFILAKKPLDEWGIHLTTYGKMIQRVSDLLGPVAKNPECLTVWFEAPQLVSSLTMNKQSFKEDGKEGQEVKKVIRHLQEKLITWLKDIGESREVAKRERVSPTLEREIATVINRLPELRFLYSGHFGQIVARPDTNGEPAALEAGMQLIRGLMPGEGGGDGVPVYPGDQDGEVLNPEKQGPRKAKRSRRTVRFGPRIERVNYPGSEMSWMEGETLLINTVHPTYLKAERKKSLGYHEAFCTFSALCEAAPLEAEEKFPILVRALEAWGAV
mgnify:CR=1 FL=1